MEKRLSHVIWSSSREPPLNGKKHTSGKCCYFNDQPHLQYYKQRIQMQPDMENEFPPRGVDGFPALEEEETDGKSEWESMGLWVST